MRLQATTGTFGTVRLAPYLLIPYIQSLTHRFPQVKTNALRHPPEKRRLGPTGGLAVSRIRSQFSAPRA
ncbi:MAG: hypothetical protein ACI4X9_07340 [Kiritimatiellia bacterium]